MLMCLMSKVQFITLWCNHAETEESVLVLKGPQGRINRAVWGPLNRTIISAGEDAVIRIWDSEVNFLFWLIAFLFSFYRGYFHSSGSHN